jgi:glycosyltransferase involved in cell wall biosynthesis
MKNQKVSVVIPTYNEERDIGECLKSLGKQSFRNFEIIVVDDGSRDRTREIARKFKKVKLILGAHRGPGFSRNLGARKAGGNILVFVDADMTFDKDYLKNLVNPILKDKTGKIIGTTHDYEVATNTQSWISALWGRERVRKEDAHKINIFRAIRKDKFLELGGFDPTNIDLDR